MEDRDVDAQASEGDAAEQPLNFEPEPEPTEEEVDAAAVASLDAVSQALEEAKKASRQIVLPEATRGGAPPWVRMPSGIVFPRGRQVLFLRFAAKWTDTPHMGEPLPVEDAEAAAIAGPGGRWRQAICWPLSVGDEKLAIGRALGDNNRLSNELTKQMVRAIDGHMVDWTGAPGPGMIDVWWDQVGSRVRMRLSEIFTRLHVMSRDETASFIESCVAVRTAG